MCDSTCMNVFECLRQLRATSNGLRLAVLAVFDNLREEVAAAAQLRHQIVLRRVLPVVQQLDHVRMVANRLQNLDLLLHNAAGRLGRKDESE